MTLYGPAVRSKRFVDQVVSGLASMYPAFDWFVRAIMDISARAFSLAKRPRWEIWVTSVRMRREAPDLHLVSSRRLRLEHC